MNTDYKPIGVSVLCLAYNHEKYIADAIEGFLMQKTSFPFEIIIHDDASTDGTAEIIRQYERNNPGLIKAIYQKENQYSKGVNINDKFFLPLAQGKYVALCDGDDYWTDPNKLQKQYDAMEKHPECMMCLHRVLDYNTLKGDSQQSVCLPQAEIKTGVMRSRDFFRIYGQNDFFNEVCYFFQAEAYKEYQRNYPLFAQLYMKNKTDDAPMLCYFASKAPVYYISDIMAVYRRFNAGSWSAGMRKKSEAEQAQYFKNIIDAQNAFGAFSGNKYQVELAYSQLYSSFNYERCLGHYKAMLDSKYDIIWKRQSTRYKKRIIILARHPQVGRIVFLIYDAFRKMFR